MPRAGPNTPIRASPACANLLDTILPSRPILNRLTLMFVPVVLWARTLFWASQIHNPDSFCCLSPLCLVIFYGCERRTLTHCLLCAHQRNSWRLGTAWGCWPWLRPCAALSSITWPKPSPCKTSQKWPDRTKSSASPRRTWSATCPMTA